MGLKNPHVEDVSYAHPADSAKSPAKIVAYCLRRPHEADTGRREKRRAGADSVWETLPKEQIFGDPDAFKRAAYARTRALKVDAKRRGVDIRHNKTGVWCNQYMHVVLSPANRRDLTNEDFGELTRPWIRDSNGREIPHFAAVHRDEVERGPHMHLCLVRDKFDPGELRALKEKTDALAAEMTAKQSHELRHEEPKQIPDRDPETRDEMCWGEEGYGHEF